MSGTGSPRIVSANLALETLARFPQAPLGATATPIEPMARLRKALNLPQQLLIKRDDAIPFGFGGNKVRKLRYVIPAAQAAGADVLITCGGLQSNHARATAAAAAAAGMRCHIVANAAPPKHYTGNALLNRLLGAEVEYVGSREERAPAMEAAAERYRAQGHHPFVIPLGASTPVGALGFAAAIGEMLEQGPAPDVIVHATSSGGTQAGLLAGCLLHGLSTRVIGISADDPPAAVERQVRTILSGMGSLLGAGSEALALAAAVEVDDGFVGSGYGSPTAESHEAQHLAASREALFVDHTYTAKALAGLIAYTRNGRIPADASVLFWHTGGQIALFA
jgi:1-aminocyclopropane-1-carboxylate deaminase/D-cysteine desulfhydrase-like pyridoxal-dependent ACC family enzyme